MSVAASFNPTSINLSANAVRKVRQLVAEEGNDGLKLRVYITGGGCSGFQYGFSFEEAAAEDDTAIEQDGVSYKLRETGGRGCCDRPAGSGRP